MLVVGVACVMEHLLLHCTVAIDVWGFFLSIFGVHWTMPSTVSAMLEGKVWGIKLWGKFGRWFRFVCCGVFGG